MRGQVVGLSVGLWLLGACPRQRAAEGVPVGPERRADDGHSAARDDGRLRIQFDVLPDVDRNERVPRYTVALRFTNLTAAPLRVYLPGAEIARFPMSTVRVVAGTAVHLVESRPHGYVITEADFPELAPGETRTFTQALHIDHVAGGGVVVRNAGFAPGTVARVDWIYQNRTERMPGGAQTLDGVTVPLFGGGPIPGIWTGSLEVRARWIVPE